MARLLSALLLASLFIVAAPARAFTPESGWWWNPDQPGIGFSIEIQDDFVFMVAFAYNQGGGATWYAAQGEMADNAFFSAPLYRRDNGTCLGCPFVPPSNTYAVGQNVAIEFDTETTGVMTWAGRTIPIERQDYYLSRTPGIDPKTELWLGEWQVVMDFSPYPSEVNFPFYGDILVFDLIDRGDPDFFVGCRPENSIVGECDQFALDNHEAVGYYCPGCGVNGLDVNFILVDDEPSVRFVYELEVGTYQFDGNMKRCPSSIPGDEIIERCLDNDDIPPLPVRGWRSASRAFVEGDDDAPNAAPDQAKRERAIGPTQSRPWSNLTLTVDHTAPKSEPRHRPNAAAASVALKAAVDRLSSKERVAQ
jgi:hypothetical protein